ncbi:MAG: hypothetical protein O2814_03790 [Bacteroidetes bacterium]|nr:hypothetical protein [Bacteroidota bacterium]MDA1224931.1 hypothetical protein [Bacteroidota bacterium]
MTIFITVSSNLIANNDPSKPIKPPHYRGLCVLNDSCAWFSGSKGTVIHTTDGGKHFDTISPRSTNTRFTYFLPYGKQTVESYTQTYDASFSLLRKDYRDIWAKNEKEAVIMSAGDSALILKTMDGGKNWTIVYTDFRKNIFLDALEIDSKTGIGMVLGDPIIPEPIIVEASGSAENSSAFSSMTSSRSKSSRNKKSRQKTKSQDPNNTRKHFAALYTTDFGSSWNNLPIGDWNLPLDSLESFFAASGTSLVIIESKVEAADSGSNYLARTKNLTVGFAGGGINPSYHIVKFKQQKRRTMKQNKRFNLSTSQPRVAANEIIPMPIAGGPGSGVYGMYLSDDGRMIAVGGNYTLPDSFNGALAHSTTANFGLKWSGGKDPQGNTGGYRSGVCISEAILNSQLTSQSAEHMRIKKCDRIAICTGTNGSDISIDNGINWFKIPKKNLSSGLYFEGSFNACAFSSNYLWMVGNSGKFQRIPISDLLSMGIK